MQAKEKDEAVQGGKTDLEELPFSGKEGKKKEKERERTRVHKREK